MCTLHAVEVKVVVCALEGTTLYCGKVILERKFHVNLKRTRLVRRLISY